MLRGLEPITEPRLASVSKNDTNNSEKLCGLKGSESGMGKTVAVKIFYIQIKVHRRPTGYLVFGRI